MNRGYAVMRGGMGGIETSNNSSNCISYLENVLLKLVLEDDTGNESRILVMYMYYSNFDHSRGS